MQQQHLRVDPQRGLRFARSAREAFGHSLDFRRPRDPDWIVGVVCKVGAAVVALLIATGHA
jgi:hypothetical protein